jgi:hypothetical protein
MRHNFIVPILLGLQLAACQAETNAPPKTGAANAKVSRAILAIPEHFQGRYEAEEKHCRIPIAERDDDEMSSQGGALVSIEPGELYFVQSFWPVQEIQYRNFNAIDIVLLNDVDMDGKKIEPHTVKLSLDENNDLQFEGRSGKLYNCPKEN